jgi:glucose/arabinose dehydrogenase
MNDLRLAALSGLLIVLPPVAGVIHTPAPLPAVIAASCDSTIQLPAGFCATLVAESLGPVRHLVVTPNGDLIASLASSRDRDRNVVAGGVVLLRDGNADGIWETRKRFGPEGGTGIALGEGYLWFTSATTIYRWKWAPGQLEPAGDPEVVVSELPAGGHSAKPIAVAAGYVYIDLGSLTNSCQEADRAARSPGKMPCTELEGRAGIWRFSASRVGQKQADGIRFGTGTRNPMALAFEPRTSVLWMASHGRDNLSSNWGYSDTMNAELPAEEFGPVVQGADYGWPYCYYDGLQQKKVQAPEYGGDGKVAGDCAGKTQPAVAFPGHWAPMSVAFYTGTAFPAEYRGGAFLAFHGSWNRAPLAQDGFRVAFAPFRDGRATGTYTTLMQGKPGSVIRPSGVAVGPDGALYVAADQQGKIWRVTYTGR